MLVLARKTSEEIIFPDLGITLEVLQVKGKTVRLGIDAPRDIRVFRGELDPPDDSDETDTPAEQVVDKSNWTDKDFEWEVNACHAF